MDVRSYTHVRQNLAGVMDEVCDRRTPIVISRQNARAVVMISLEEFNAMAETLHLLSSPRNAERLRRGIAEAEGGRTVEREPLDE